MSKGDLSELEAILARARQIRREAAAALKRDIKQFEDQRDALDGTIRMLRDQVERLEFDAPLNGSNRRTAGKGNGKAKATPHAQRKGKRVRRSADELAKHAKAIAEFVTAAGDEGRSGSDIRAKYPVGEGTTIKGFVEQYAGVSLKTKGRKAAMRYFAR